MIRSFQGLRFVFISFIVFSHLVVGFDFGGDCGVAFFLMLSGFILSYVYANKVLDGRESSLMLVMHQLKKFYPLYITMMLAMLLINFVAGKSINVLGLTADVLLLQSWFPDNDITFYLNGPAWFLSDIMFCYAVFVPLYKIIHKQTVKWLLISFIAYLFFYIVISSLVSDDKVNDIIYTNPLFRLFDFVIGILLYRLYNSQITTSIKKRLTRNKYYIICIEFCILVLFALLYFCYNIFPARIHCAMLFWPFMFLIILIFPILEQQKAKYSVITRLLSSQLFVWLGGLSMEIFLIHNFVTVLMNSLLRKIGILQIMKTNNSIFTVIIVYLIVILISFLVKRIDKRLKPLTLLRKA